MVDLKKPMDADERRKEIVDRCSNATMDVLAVMAKYGDGMTASERLCVGTYVA